LLNLLSISHLCNVLGFAPKLRGVRLFVPFSFRTILTKGPGDLYVGRLQLSHFHMEASGPPRFLGNPEVYMPCSLDPDGTPEPGLLQLIRSAFRLVNNVGSRDMYFEAQ
jgi:hypothetical protein